MNIHPSGNTLALLAYAGWGLVAAEMIADVMPKKAFLGLVAMAGTLSTVAAIRYHGAIVEAATRGHAETMGAQVLNAERWSANDRRGETRAHIDAVLAYANTCPFRVAEEQTS
jgi:hypothetical protein